MTEWWTYGLQDFLLFAPRTYHRLFELYNAEVWPLQVPACAAGLALAGLVGPLCGRRWAWRSALVLLALAWAWVAWAFHLQRYATINWAAPWFAAAFAAQALALLVAAALPARAARRAGLGRRVGAGLILFAVLAQPVVGVAAGRNWSQAEWFGLAPDATAVATLGVLLALPGAARGWLWVAPLAWCLVGSLTLWAMRSADAAAPVLGAAVAGIAALWRLRRSVCRG